jgi:hypothetical protein
MSIPTFSAKRSVAIREGLVVEVENARRPVRRRGWMNIAVFALSGALVGGAVSGAAWAAGSGLDGGRSPAAPEVRIDDPNSTGVPAPAGIIPGSPIVSLMDGGGSIRADAHREVALDAPEGATHVRVTVACLSLGTLYWGLSADGNNPSIFCSGASDIGIANTWYDFDLSDGDTLYLDPKEGSFSVGWQFLNLVETAWGVTETGETYGVAKPDGRTPDLIAVTGTAPDGSFVNGYARWDEMQGPMPENPKDAATWNPEPRELPVFAPDGVTQIGVFTVG